VPVQELNEWLSKLRLSKYEQAALDWCHKMGAVELSEVKESWQDLADTLELKQLERKRMEKDVGAPAPQPAPAPAPKPAPRPASGKAFGPPDDPRRYALMEQLGSGATATVHKCMRGSEVFAVKTINLSTLKLQRDFEQILIKLRREVSILCSLRHHNVVSIIDVVEEPSALRLVIELVEGGELFDRIAAVGAFTEPVARYVFTQVAEGLSYIHSKDIVYRDLKPENILVSRVDQVAGKIDVKLSDFGHSKFINDGFSIAMTRCGTPQYWAPEVSDPRLAQKGYDQTVDLWSLGVALYVMLQGAYPFDGVGGKIEDQIRTASFTFKGASISDSAKQLIKSLIKVNPKDRITLQQCLAHPWVAEARGASQPLRKLASVFNPQSLEQRIRLEVKPTKDQVQKLRLELQKWMIRFRFSATVKHTEATDDGADAGGLSEVIATFGDPGMVDVAQLEAARRALESLVEDFFRQREQLRCCLVIHGDDGAGLELFPEDEGMRVTEIFDPTINGATLRMRDLIVEINGASLRGDPDIEDVFRAHFKDGVEILVLRDL